MVHCPICRDLIFTYTYKNCVYVNEKLLCDTCSPKYKQRHHEIMHLARQTGVIEDTVEEIPYNEEMNRIGY
jgi:hypothetical protein